MGVVENNLKSYNADTQAMTFFGPILSPAGLVQQSAVMALTNAQVLALPTTPISLIAAPGAGFVIQVVRATLSLNATAGAYTNVDAAAAVLLGYGGIAVKATNAATMNGTATVAQKSLYMLNGALISTAVLVTPGGISALQSTLENVAIQIGVNNAAAGVFTGGNAANTFRVSIDYLVIAL